LKGLSDVVSYALINGKFSIASDGTIDEFLILVFCEFKEFKFMFVSSMHFTDI